MYTVLGSFIVKFDKILIFSMFFLQKQSINFEKNPLTIQIFYSQRTPNVFDISTNEKKDYCNILIIKVFMTDFRLFFEHFSHVKREKIFFSKFQKSNIFSLIMKTNAIF